MEIHNGWKLMKNEQCGTLTICGTLLVWEWQCTMKTYVVVYLMNVYIYKYNQMKTGFDIFDIIDLVRDKHVGG